jgi:hypothetical protein
MNKKIIDGVCTDPNDEHINLCEDLPVSYCPTCKSFYYEEDGTKYKIYFDKKELVE